MYGLSNSAISNTLSKLHTFLKMQLLVAAFPSLVCNLIGVILPVGGLPINGQIQTDPVCR